MRVVIDDPALRDQVLHYEEHAPKPASYARPSHRIPAPLEALVPTELFTHQAAAFDAAMNGHDVVLATGTNSGKTLGFLLPVLTTYYREPAARAILIYPTKALAQDQLARIRALIPVPADAGTYDGDTSPNARNKLRQTGRILLTNPEMLHLGILASHENWAKWLRTTRFVVFDEMHVYRGVFGSHFGNVMRRLIRLMDAYGREPQLIAGSATISNPGEHFRNLTGRSATVIDQDGSPRGKRTFIFYNPPHINPTERLSPNVATATLLAHLVKSNVRSLAFSRTRVSAELVGKYAADQAGCDLVESYRAGYTPKERRDIEKRLFQGKILGLSATNAMELGVDVGQLDAVLINGFPGTMSSFWQQAGRAGRGSRDGITIFVAHHDPLEQFLVRDPASLLQASVESATANPINPAVLEPHLKCAAFESPLRVTELDRFGPTAVDLAEKLDRSGELTFRNGAFYSNATNSPAREVNLRASTGNSIQLICQGEELGSMEEWRALRSAFPGAVYLHRGQSFMVRELDLNSGVAHLESTDVPYYTQSVIESIVIPQHVRHAGPRHDLLDILVTSTVVGFRKKQFDGDQVLDMIDLNLPPQQFETVACRFHLSAIDPEEDALTALGGLHGAEHALLAVAPVVAGCDRNDLGSSWTVAAPDTLQPAIFLYDQVPGGVGLAEKLYENADCLKRLARQLIAGCDCDEGCPACLYSSRCESRNEPLSKVATVKLLG